jgi:hypothetical protein
MNIYGQARRSSTIPANPHKFASKFNNPKLDNALEMVPKERHATAADALRRMHLALKDNKEYREAFLETIEVEGLSGLLSRPPTSSDWLFGMMGSGILPTPALLSLFTGNPRDAEAAVSAETKKIAEGGFDGSPLHREIAFFIYKRHGGKLKFPETSNLPTLENGMLFERKKLDAVEPTAAEAVETLRFITEMAQHSAGVPLLVVGNKTYGKNFVVKPIESRLRGIGAHVVYEYIQSKAVDMDLHSNETGIYGIARVFDAIEKMDPDIVVVDGTSSLAHFDSNRKYARFPAAMKGYYDTIEKRYPGRYAIGFQTLDGPEDRVYFSLGRAYLESRPQGTGPRKLTFLCPVRDKYNEGSNAELDDLYEHSQEKALGFGPRGIEEFTRAVDSVNYFIRFEYVVAKAVEKLLGAE